MNQSQVGALPKKELKNYVNDKGFFCAVKINKTNAPNDEKKPEGVPEGAMYFEGIASTEELNRNGYIIKIEAWRDAIAGYMENPVVLLQHDARSPIGQMLSAEITDKGLQVTGYVYDDLTEGRISRGLINALSTGHLTVDVEFKNEETGEVLTHDEFKRLNWEEQSKDYWIVMVSKLEWLETSTVTIGANRKSFITNRQLLKNYIETMHQNDTTEEVQEETTDEGTDQTDTTLEETKQEEDEKPAGETPAASEDEAENATPEEGSETVSVSVEEVQQVQNMLSNLIEVGKADKAKIANLEKANAALTSKLESIPVPKGLSNHAVKKDDNKAPQKGAALRAIFAKSGINI